MLRPFNKDFIISRDVTFDEGGQVARAHQEEDVEPFAMLLPVLFEDEQGEEVVHMEEPVHEEEPPPHQEGVQVGHDGGEGEEGDAQDEADGPMEHQPPLRRSNRERRPPQPYWEVNHDVERACVAVTKEDEPTTYKQAVQGPDSKQWEQAMREEMESITNNGTWRLVDLPKDRKAVGCKWIFRIKRDAQGNIKTWKARLVAKGYAQTEGVDYFDTFAPVAKFVSIRVLLSWAAIMGWEVHHMDVKTAFLHGKLEEEIYMEQPEGFAKKGEEDMVCLLVKSLYGLKQAPRAWNKKLHEQLVTLGFKRCESDHNVYLREHKKGLVYLLVYVDDMLIVADSMLAMDACKVDLSKCFTMTDLGEASYFLGMEINRDKDANTIHLQQGAYIKKVLERFDMADCAPMRTPFPTGIKLPLGAEGNYNKSFPEYASAVGSLMYLMVCTRPDLAFAVGAVSRFMSCPVEEHWEAVKRILRYVQGTKDNKLVLGGVVGEATMVGYTDADWGGNDNNRRSISGYCFLLGEGAVSWSSKKQTSVALSSTEAEYMALTQATKEAMWLKRFLGELNLHKGEALTIKVDNQSCIALAKNPEFHARTKHIDIQCHFIREKVEEGEVTLEYCPTRLMVADILTKPLPRDKHEWCTKAMGIHPYI